VIEKAKNRLRSIFDIFKKDLGKVENKNSF
jgi:hypothetical protein